MRATGANEAMARAQGINTWWITIAGVGVANGLTAFAGASVAQVQGYADVAMGFGILINALAALIIGEAIIGRATILQQVLAPFVGSIVYYQVISAGPRARRASVRSQARHRPVRADHAGVAEAQVRRRALPERPVNA